MGDKSQPWRSRPRSKKHKKRMHKRHLDRRVHLDVVGVSGPTGKIGLEIEQP
jgi:hypothetical protein